MKPSKYLCAILVLHTVLSEKEPNPKTDVMIRPGVSSQQPITKAQSAAVREAYGRLPLDFEANQGQTDSRVKFLARRGSSTFFLTSTDAYWRRATSSGAGVTLRMKLLGANPQPPVRGHDELPGRSNYFKDNDPTKWRTNVPHYARVEYRDIYPGVNLIYHGTQRQLEYDFVVSPDADPGRIALQYEGADRLEIDTQGDLVLHTAAGELRQKKPVIYQQAGTTRREIAGGYMLDAQQRIRFELGAYDRHSPLIIDPLVYSTYLGGSGPDDGEGIAVDSSGNAYVTGATASPAFPTTPGSYSHVWASAGFGDGLEEDAFVTKLNPTGTALIYSTYLGGQDNDQGNAVQVDSSGNAYIAGITASANFPTTPNAYQTAPGMDSAGEVITNGFVAKLNPTGSGLLYSTYLHKTTFGTVTQTQAIGLAVLNGNAYVAGNNLQPGSSDMADLNDGFVAELNSTGTGLMYYYSFGGKDDDEVESLAVDASGNAYVVGETKSTDFPATPGAYQTTFGGGDLDGFLLKLNPAGAAIVFATYLGGKGTETIEDVAVDASGNIYLTGSTSGNFPTTPGAYQTTLAGGNDGFVVKMNPTGTTLIYSTLLGGIGDEHIDALALDAAGYVYLTGSTKSKDFPTTPGAAQKTFGGGSTDGDAFVAKLNPSGSALVFSTYLGGSLDDYGDAIAIDASGNVYITGFTPSTDFPVSAGAFQTKCGTDTTCNNAAGDAFVAKIDTVIGVPASLIAVSGNNQSGAPGVRLPQPLVVQVLDAHMGPVTGALVTFSATNASVNPTSATTDANGNASTQVTLGSASGAASVTATTGGAAAMFSFTVAGNVGPVVNAVVNGASFVGGGIVAGEIATIFGTNLTSATGINLTSSLPLPTEFLKVSVIVNDPPVPLFAVDNVNGQQQVNFQVPWEVAGKGMATVAVSNNGVTGAAINVPVLAAQPGIFAYSVGGNSFGAILHANFQLADTGHPAMAGETVLIYCTGLGVVNSPPADGAAGSGQTTVATPTVTIGGKNAAVSFSGLAPGFVGLYQINAVVPAGLAAGNQAVAISMEGSSSNPALLPVK